MKFICIFILFFLSSFNAVGQQENVMIMDHSHMPINVPAKTPIPALSLQLNKDAMSGYNLILTLQHYHLIPPPPNVLSMADLMKVAVSDSSGFIEGHAHLYVNGRKIQRVYGENVHIPQEHFKKGINTVSVTLNNHGHMYWVANKKKILATIYVDQSKTPFITYQFESFPVK